MKTTQLLTGAALVAGANAFMMPLAARPMRPVTAMAAAPSSDIQTLAQSCLDGGCDVEMVNELVGGLKGRRSSIIMQLATVDDLLRQLEGSHADKQSGAVNDIIASVARLFSKGDDDYPSLSAPTGFSGDTHRGTKDAWDYKVSKK